MKKIRKTLTCGCCGQSFDTDLILSVYYSDFELDGRPLGGPLVDDFIECPSCHYVSRSIEKKLDDSMIRKVRSEDINKNRYERALDLTEQGTERIAILQRYIWEVLDTGESDEEVHRLRCILIGELNSELEESPSYDLALLYVEQLRLTRQFEIADSLIRELETAGTKVSTPRRRNVEVFLAFLRFEKKLVNSKDSLPHKRSEVMV